MELTFKPIEARDLRTLSGYFCLRPNLTCDSVVLDSFIWRDFAGVKWAEADGRAIVWLMESGDGPSSAMPQCRAEDLRTYFEESVSYFNDVLGKPFRIMLADEAGVEALSLMSDPRFTVTEEADLRDYLYDGEALRTLSGKKLHKKKNHLNSFLREYEGRYEYLRISCEERDEVRELLSRWRDEKGEEAEIHLDFEMHGIGEMLDSCGELAYIGVRMAGVRVDGRLEAFTVGSYNSYENMAVIHIEKANAAIKGLYQFINQQFLVHEFPDAVIINREDDLGEPGLRQAKESYHPMGYARKYSIKQVWNL